MGKEPRKMKTLFSESNRRGNRAPKTRASSRKSNKRPRQLHAPFKSYPQVSRGSKKRDMKSIRNLQACGRSHESPVSRQSTGRGDNTGRRAGRALADVHPARAEHWPTCSQRGESTGRRAAREEWQVAGIYRMTDNVMRAE